jgi:hypothetical protein
MGKNHIRFTFTEVRVHRKVSFWGSDDWKISVSADGKTSEPFEAEVSKNSVVALPETTCSIILDVSGKKPGDKIKAQLNVTAERMLGNKDLGSVEVTVEHPLAAPTESTLDSASYYSAAVRVDLLEEISTAGPPGVSLFCARRAKGTNTFNTLSSQRVEPRLEICPVVPVPSHNKLWKRPKPPAGVKGPKVFPRAAAIPLTGTPDLNCLPNPSLIPVLDPKDASFAKQAARIGLTYLQPGNIDVANLVWKVSSGPAKIHGESKGVDEILVYGTSAEADPDKLAVIEVRWGAENGPVMATFRAWVGKVLLIPFRATIFIGADPSAVPRTVAADAQRHIQLANVLLWQSGLKLVPDTSPMAWDGATPAFNPARRDDALRGIYTCSVPDGTTQLIPRNAAPVPTRLNFRPGVMHLAYIKSFDKAGLAGVATDRPQLDGADADLDGAPSSSWVSPTGVPPEPDAAKVTMKTMSASDERKDQKDLDYLTMRGLPASAYKSHFAVTLPDYTKADDPDWPQTVAHEIGHVLGLLHRGNPGTDEDAGKLGSSDGVNDPDGKGHPFKENVMSYGYTLSQDLDLLQTSVIRKHPVLKRPAPKAHFFVTRNGKRVPHYCQASAPWGDLKLGKDRTKKNKSGEEIVVPAKTLKAAGCAITSVAMVLSYFGRDVNPQAMDEHLDANEGYTGDSVYFGTALRCKEEKGGVKVEIAQDIKDPAKFGQVIDQEFKANRPVIAHVDYEDEKGGAEETAGNHFIVLVGRTEEGLTIMNDPASGGGNGGTTPTEVNILELTTRKKGYNLVRILTFKVT